MFLILSLLGAIVVVSLMFGALIDKRFPLSTSLLASANDLNETHYNYDVKENEDLVTEEKLTQEKIKFVMAVSVISGITQVSWIIIN